MKSKEHWEGIYQSKKHTGVSWYRPHLDPSLSLISKLGLNHESWIIDVGGGASTLADDLLKRGFRNITVFDISAKALQISKKRLGKRAARITGMEADITKAKLPENRYDLWHDRAVFHFLTDARDRMKYIKVLDSSLRRGGHLIIAAFNLNGPVKCSGLEIVRYSPETLSNELGAAFELVESFDEAHKTPFKTIQNFVYCRFRKL
jgi:SAM-dependent methyltransferase